MRKELSLKILAEYESKEHISYRGWQSIWVYRRINYKTKEILIDPSCLGILLGLIWKFLFNLVFA